MRDQKNCLNCRHHSKTERPKTLGVADEDLEQILLADENEVFVICRNAGRTGDRPEEMGKAEDKPGDGCGFWEAPSARGLSPELDALLAKRS